MALLIYFAQVSLYAAIFWLMFRVLWRDRPYLSQSRGFLLLSLVLPALLPLIRLPRPASINASGFQEVLPAFKMNASTQVSQLAAFNWAEALIWLYATIVLIQITKFGWGFIRIHRKLKQGDVRVHSEYKLITECQLGPGTLGRSIFFPSKEVDPVILEHERAHIRHGHHFDLWLLQMTRVLFWFSPAHWLLASELKALHEFQADQEAKKITEITAYQSLLVSRALGSVQALPIAHFFSPQLLKRRIMMLQTQKAPRMKFLLAATVLLSAGFLSTVLFAQTKQSSVAVAANGSESKKSIYPDIPPQNLRPNYGEVTLSGTSMTFKVVEKKPDFKGDLFGFLRKNLQTEGLNLDDKTPACIVQFVVASTGEIQNPVIQQSSGVPAWDAEVMRVIKLMPAWTPGMQQDKAVDVTMTMPVFHNGGGC